MYATLGRKACCSDSTFRKGFSLSRAARGSQFCEVVAVSSADSPSDRDRPRIPGHLGACSSIHCGRHRRVRGRFPTGVGGHLFRPSARLRSRKYSPGLVCPITFVVKPRLGAGECCLGYDFSRAPDCRDRRRKRRFGRDVLYIETCIGTFGLLALCMFRVATFRRDNRASAAIHLVIFNRPSNRIAVAPSYSEPKKD